MTLSTLLGTLPVRNRREPRPTPPELLTSKGSKEDISKTAHDLLARGRVLLAVESYRSGKAFIEKAAEIAGLSITETMDALTELGVEANLEKEDYLASLSNLKEAW